MTRKFKYPTPKEVERYMRKEWERSFNNYRGTFLLVGEKLNIVFENEKNNRLRQDTTGSGAL